MGTAYNKLYLDDTNFLSEDLFQTIAKKNVDFQKFVAEYLNSNCRWQIDRGNSRYMNMTTDEFMAYLAKEVELKPGTPDIDYLEAGWIGIVYNLLQFYTGMPSKEIYKKIDYSRMKFLFGPLHTVDYEVAVNKIIKGHELNVVLKE